MQAAGLPKLCCSSADQSSFVLAVALFLPLEEVGSVLFKALRPFQDVQHHRDHGTRAQQRRPDHGPTILMGHDGGLKVDQR